jgi:hypothetical protein
LLFTKVPSGVLNRPRLPRIYASAVRRGALGPLVFSSNLQNAVQTTDGAKMFHPGQLLGFEEVPSTTPPVTETSTGDQVQTRHDLNFVDQEAVGLDNAAMSKLGRAAAAAQDKLVARLRELQASRKSLEVRQFDLQKSINEITRVISGVDAILELDGSDSEMVQIRQDQLARKSSLQGELALTIEQYNALPGQINALRDKLTELSNLVK